MSLLAWFKGLQKHWKLRKRISKSIVRSWRVCTKRVLSEGIADLPFGATTRMTILQHSCRKTSWGPYSSMAMEWFMKIIKQKLGTSFASGAFSMANCWISYAAISWVSPKLARRYPNLRFIHNSCNLCPDTRFYRIPHQFQSQFGIACNHRKTLGKP